MKNNNINPEVINETELMLAVIKTAKQVVQQPNVGMTVTIFAYFPKSQGAIWRREFNLLTQGGGNYVFPLHPYETNIGVGYACTVVVGDPTTVPTMPIRA